MILVVDDNEDSVRIVRMIVQSAGFEVRVARNGKQALEAVDEAIPELIIMDVMMPEMDGVEALKALRESPRTARIPVILLTAKGQDEDVFSGYQSGAAYYMTKPFAAKQLLNGIRLLLGKEAP
jgi:DNA-binding response OmpR family regulator